MKNSSTVHDLPSSERPRERLLQFGAEAMSVPELLALILGSGNKGKSVMTLSQELLNQFGNHKKLADASVTELCKVPGIKFAKAAKIKAAFELGKRLNEFTEERPSKVVKNAEDVFGIIKNKLKGKKKEHFMVISFDTRNHVNRIAEINTISIGSLDSSIVHPREAFKEAIVTHAASVIFIHNHPSGNPEPSEEDIKLTKRLVEVGEIVGIEVLDHIIVCDNTYLSMKAVNLI